VSSEVEILQALIIVSTGDATGDPETSNGWHNFLALLALATHAEDASLELRATGGQSRRWHVGQRWGRPEGLDVDQMRSGRVYSQADLPVNAGASRPIRAMKLWIPEFGTAVLTLQREAIDFRALDGLQLSKLSPYLGPAVKGWTNHAQRYALAAIDRQIGDKLGAGWIIFSLAGKVLEMAEGVGAWLSECNGIHLRSDGWFSFSAPEVAVGVRLACAEISKVGALPQHVTLSQNPLVQIALSIETFNSEMVILGHLRRATLARSLPIERVALCFGLSRSEARLAVCICDGFSLKSAAEHLGWTLETTRSCSKRSSRTS
jgi:hypothetical protein